MLQRELAERLFAAPRTKAYSAVSVMVQLSCALEAQRPVGRTVFSPQPRVDSAFVTFTRNEPRPSARRRRARHARADVLRPAAQAARELAGRHRAPPGAEPLTRAQVQDALAALGLPETTRPEELAPPVFVALGRQLGWLEAS